MWSEQMRYIAPQLADRAIKLLLFCLERVTYLVVWRSGPVSDRSYDGAYLEVAGSLAKREEVEEMSVRFTGWNGLVTKEVDELGADVKL